MGARALMRASAKMRDCKQEQDEGATMQRKRKLHSQIDLENSDESHYFVEGTIISVVVVDSGGRGRDELD